MPVRLQLHVDVLAAALEARAANAPETIQEALGEALGVPARAKRPEVERALLRAQRALRAWEAWRAFHLHAGEAGDAR